MVKPAVAYLDIISKLHDEFDLPIGAYLCDRIERAFEFKR